jgi:hypothetical protein
VALEQENAKVFLKHPDASADARLRNAKRVGGMTKVQIFRDGQRLDQRGHRDAATERLGPWSRLLVLGSPPSHGQTTRKACETARAKDPRGAVAKDRPAGWSIG